MLCYSQRSERYIYLIHNKFRVWGFSSSLGLEFDREFLKEKLVSLCFLVIVWKREMGKLSESYFCYPHFINN